MKKNHRRELYSPASPESLRAHDAVGPDEVRVTLRVEPAVDRYRRWRFMFLTPPVVTDPGQTYLTYRVFPDLVQRHVFRDRWEVDAEADTGERCRVKARNREVAITYARQIHDGVEKHGVSFLKTFAH